jgi:hypothetical protein
VVSLWRYCRLSVSGHLLSVFYPLFVGYGAWGVIVLEWLGGGGGGAAFLRSCQRSVWGDRVVFIEMGCLFVNVKPL